jgi:rRNA processing protein Gar1
MREVGEVLHTARSGRIILRLESEVSAGTVLVDEKGRNAVKVMELMGPVSKPYASAIPGSSKFGTKGQKVYVSG